MSHPINNQIIDSYLDFEDEDIPNGEAETERTEFIADMLREDGCVIDTHGQADC